MHHDRDWSKYNRHLVDRGKIEFWVHRKTLNNWKAPTSKKNGHPFVYGEELIKAMCFIRFKFHFSLRETQGFFLSLIGLMTGLCKVPCYTQLCRRLKTIKLPTELMEKKGVKDIVLDPTGLKVYGEGEWRAEKYGGRKAWKKLHVAMDLNTGKLVMVEITDDRAHDTTFVEKALQKTNGRRGTILIDGIADSRRCYTLAEKYNKVLITPPKKGAILHDAPGYERRNDAIRVIRGLGGDKVARSIWGKSVGYNRRVVVESMIARWKSLFGGKLKSRCEQRIRKEAQLKAIMINGMIDRLKAA